jgi:hypothetical protein
MQNIEHVHVPGDLKEGKRSMDYRRLNIIIEGVVGTPVEN